ncbi:MAG: acyl-ACP thioesterase [Alistipes sp.]|nr:acyl-ACP thioesterase [Alistipes sp.]
MGAKTTYKHTVDTQNVDFTLRATVDSICQAIFNTAGVDAMGRGFGLDSLSENKRSWVLSRFAVEMDYRPKQYADYGVTTWVNTNTRMLSTRNFELHNSEGECFARSVSQWCMIDFERRVPINLEEMYDAFREHMCDCPSPCEPPRKVVGVVPTQQVVHKVVYSDIDFNCHVNTMRYIGLMIDMLPIDYMREERVFRLDIHFMHECRLGQTLTVGYEQRENLSLFEVKADDGTVACRASIEWR